MLGRRLCGEGFYDVRTRAAAFSRPTIRTRLVELATRRFVSQLASDVLTLGELQQPRPDTSKVGSRAGRM